MEDIEIPHYFICPISLQIMSDPVTALTGITYDRESIELWLMTAEEALCPVTKQPLDRGSDLTPNHTLRRLIQAWCVANANYGIDRIPTPKSPLSKSQVLKLLRNVGLNSLNTLDNLLANDNEKNRRCMAEAGTAKSMIFWIMSNCCSKEATSRTTTNGLEQALRILHLTWMKASPENNQLVKENFIGLIDSLLSIFWYYDDDDNNKSHNCVEVQTRAALILKMVIEVLSMSALERLKLDFFERTVNVLRRRVSEQATKAILHVLIEACPWGRNRMKIVEAGAVFKLVELELGGPEKSTTEMIFCLLAHLCSCADGRAQLLKHAGGIAMVAKRTLRVSTGTDDRAVHILTLIGKFSGTDEVLSEMLRVGAVSKLCMVMQADCAAYLKKKAREILRLHSNVWNNSPCIAFYLLSTYPS